MEQAFTSVLESARFIAENSADVQVDEKGVTNAAAKVT